MDLLSHAVYGATVCSRTGLAGGSKGPSGLTRRHWFADWTLWSAAAFGLLPDVVSMGAPLFAFLRGGMQGNFFRQLGGQDIVCYRYMHSLVVALAVSGALWLVSRPLGVSSLAWPLHVCMDAFTHGSGKFQTTVFYPASTWGIDGVRWWEHPGLVLAYWLALPALWLGLWVWRRRRSA